MSEDTPNPEPTYDVDPGHAQWMASVAPDMALATLLEALTADGREGEISLLVGGTWITGTAVAETAWIDAQTGGGPGHLLTIFRDRAERLESDLRAQRTGETTSSTPPVLAFVHLKNAKSVQASGLSPASGLFWRGRLSEVQGWSLGALRAIDY